MFESMGGAVRPDADDDLMLDPIFGGTAGRGSAMRSKTTTASSRRTGV